MAAPRRRPPPLASPKGSGASEKLIPMPQLSTGSPTRPCSALLGDFGVPASALPYAGQSPIQVQQWQQVGARLAHVFQQPLPSPTPMAGQPLISQSLDGAFFTPIATTTSSGFYTPVSRAGSIPVFAPPFQSPTSSQAVSSVTSHGPSSSPVNQLSDLSGGALAAKLLYIYG
mmetsp:Transcript_97877/g.174301  ORF Transcript_97877/g.174301 Transcript_97877/m.174301 type:complete len:172 (-) Transcript_97877:87-602(-)